MTITITSAADNVFGTYELVEQILLHLPLRTLLLSQGTTKTICSVVKSSQRIKRALFLAPASEPLAFFRIEHHGTPSIFEKAWQTGQDGRPVQPVTNPFLASLSNKEDESGRFARSSGIDPLVCTNLQDEDGQLVGFGTSEERKEPSGNSLEAMLVTQPPVSYLRPLSLPSWPCRRVAYISQVKTMTGISLGSLARPVPESDDSSDAKVYVQTKMVELVNTEAEKRGLIAWNLPEARVWKVLDRGVDEITGLEMLEILELM